MQTFSNEPLDIASLPQYQKVVVKPLNPNYWKIIVINISIVLIVVACTIAGILLINESTRYLFLIILAFISASALLFIVYKLSFQRRGVAVRERDIIYRSGVLATKTTIVPFNRIQHVALKEGIFSRMYKLGTVEIFTAGGASGNLEINGLTIEEANQLKELLLKNLGNDAA